MHFFFFFAGGEGGVGGGVGGGEPADSEGEGAEAVVDFDSENDTNDCRKVIGGQRSIACKFPY